MVIIDPKKLIKEKREEDQGLGPKIVLTPENAARLGFEILKNPDGTYWMTEDGRYVSRKIRNFISSAGFIADCSKPKPETNHTPHLISLADKTIWNILDQNFEEMLLAYENTKKQVMKQPPGIARDLEETIIEAIKNWHAQAKNFSFNTKVRCFYDTIYNQSIKVFDRIYVLRCKMHVNDPQNHNKIKYLSDDPFKWCLTMAVLEPSNRQDSLFQITAGDARVVAKRNQRHKFLLAAGSLDGYGNITGYEDFNLDAKTHKPLA